MYSRESVRFDYGWTVQAFYGFVSERFRCILSDLLYWHDRFNNRRELSTNHSAFFFFLIIYCNFLWTVQDTFPIFSFLCYSLVFVKKKDLLTYIAMPRLWFLSYFSASRWLSTIWKWWWVVGSFSHVLLQRILRVHFFKKIQDWILKSQGIRKWILRFLTIQINQRYIRRRVGASNPRRIGFDYGWTVNSFMFSLASVSITS